MAQQYGLVVPPASTRHIVTHRELKQNADKDDETDTEDVRTLMIKEGYHHPNMAPLIAANLQWDETTTPVSTHTRDEYCPNASNNLV